MTGWSYDGKNQFPYGDDLSYSKAAKFLDDGPVEDWGCGTAYAKRFFKSPYIGVDGASGFADRVCNLVSYRPTAWGTAPHGILMRHVIEHNVDWKTILENALVSCKKLALIIFTPFSPQTYQMAWNPGYEVPDISFRREDLIDVIERNGFAWRSESFESQTQYHAETIFYCQRGRTRS
jgi:hypothetical protein